MRDSYLATIARDSHPASPEHGKGFPYQVDKEAGIVPLPFFNAADQRELDQRLQLARHSEEKVYRHARAELTQDLVTRGLANSTLYTSGLLGLHVGYLQRMAGAMREAIFDIIKTKKYALTDSDEAAISEQIATYLQQLSGKFPEELESELQRRGLGSSCLNPKPAAEKRIKEVIQREAVAEVSTKVAALRRELAVERRSRRCERGERLVWLVIGGVIGGVLAQLIPRLWKLIPWPWKWCG